MFIWAIGFLFLIALLAPAVVLFAVERRDAQKLRDTKDTIKQEITEEIHENKV